MDKLNKHLLDLADILDNNGDIKNADYIDALIKKLAQDWSAKDKQKKAYDLWHKYQAGQLTKQQYETELKKIYEDRKSPGGY